MNRIVRLVTTATLAALLAGIVVPAVAEAGPRPARREARQCQRIERGLRCGQLGPREARRLHVGQRHIRRMELRARADGRIGPRERARLQRAMDRQDCRIYRLRHDGRAI